MSNSNPPTHTAYRYMARFRCIGAECEDSCCTGGWGITLDREHYKLTKQALGGSHAGRQEFDAKVKLVKGVAYESGRHALMVLQNGDCGFLRQDRLCSLQARFGERVLSDTCSTYPRQVSIIGNRRELAGTTSCPEVARQLLLAPDAMELVEVPAVTFSRPIVHTRIDPHPAAPYERYHDELKNLMLDLLADARYPLRTRLSFMAYFANRTLEFLHDKVESLDEERLLSEVERIQDASFREALHQQFEALETDVAFPSRVVVAMISARSEIAQLRALLDGVARSYRKAIEHDDARGSEADVQRVVKAYSEHKRLWSAYDARIDQYFANYAMNFWARKWYISSPNLLTHGVHLLVRLAALRFLLLGHPLLAEVRIGDEAEETRALDRAVVDVVQRFSRAFDHDRTFRAELHEKLADANVLSLAHALCLARF